MSDSDGDLELLEQVVTSFGGSQRAGQRKMVQLVAKALAEDEHLIVQAGTGTGKSLGYLVPAIRWAQQEDKRLIVSTSTVALQRQIVGKDAPAVLDFCAPQMDVALLKGWSHYACIHKVTGGYPQEESLFEGVSSWSDDSSTTVGEEVVRARQWALESDTGDRDDLVPGVSDRAWRQVSVTTDACLGQTCPMRDDCFPAQARIRASEAAVVVTNHAMLGVHCDGKTPVLGEFNALIVDEAHDLERAVSSQTTQRLFVPALAGRARRVERLALVSTNALVEAAQELEDYLSVAQEGLLRERDPDLEVLMRRLDDAVRACLQQVASESEADSAEKRLATAALSDVEAFLTAWDRDPAWSITWLTHGEDKAPTLYCAPLEVAPWIAQHLIAERPAIFTSATLKLGGSFEPIKRSLGISLAGEPTVCEDVGTPFDMSKQGILYVAKDLPAPPSSGVSQSQLDQLVELAKASGGGVLALFSSRRAAEEAGERLREELSTPVLIQGEEQISALVQQFSEDRNSSLVGTLSLWQGIDVRGDTCRLVVIDRVPFPVPSDPVIRARSDHANSQGRNAFREVSLSHAALLLSQGVGRLIRSDHDRGVVAILDSRLATRSYGGFLRRSLPPFWPTTDLQTVLGALRRLDTAANSKPLPEGDS
ncbi:MAG: ATP-dependent DNA helicase [Actinomycetaceae bacterium]|nr:ATP-dependent DNA helicase [Actinomycetaceae bacterium]